MSEAPVQAEFTCFDQGDINQSPTCWMIRRSSPPRPPSPPAGRRISAAPDTYDVGFVNESFGTSRPDARDDAVDALSDADRPVAYFTLIDQRPRHAATIGVRPCSP